MASLAEQLISGPRGRALCLAAGLPDYAWRALWSLELAPDSKSGVPWYDDVPAGVLSATQVDSVRVLREALGEVRSIDPRSVRDALERTVDNAVYWQDPRAEEMVGSLPELRPELRRIAEAVAVSSAAAWWTEPFDPQQFEVRLLPVDHVAAIDAPAAEILADVHGQPRYLDAWWSVPPFGLVVTEGAPGGVPTGLYLVEDGFGQVSATVHRANAASPRVAEIDSAEAWAALCRSHPLEVTEKKRRDWHTTTGIAETRWVMPDWAEVAGEYDAVHLQVGAYLAASGTAIPVEPGMHSVIAGWAPGNTFWLTDVVQVEPEGWLFVKDGDDQWRPAEETE